MRSVRSLVAATAAAALASVLLTGCFTGERAHFAVDADAAAAAVSDPAIQAVLTKLTTTNTSQFTATYTVLTKFGNTTTTATVAQLSPGSVSITIGHVRFLQQDTGSQTCELTTGVCEADILDQRVSDTQITHDFYSSSTALKLRQDVNTMIKPAAASTKDIAGQVATCAEVFYADGSKVYCALDNGLLAQQDSPDVRIDLTSFTTGADPALFTGTTLPGG